MTTRRHEGAADVVIAAVLLVFLILWRACTPRTASGPSVASLELAAAVTTSRHCAAYQPGPDPALILQYSEGDQTLRVTEHAPRGLLVCLRGDCRLVEEWLGK